MSVSRYLLKSLDRIELLLKGKRASIFLDYDGTITAITGRPEDAHLTFPTKDILKLLPDLYPAAVISGRKLSDVRGLVGLNGFTYAGNHGMEVWDEGFTMVFDIGRTAREELKGLEAPFRQLEKRFRGVVYENKRLNLTMHYRLLSSRDFMFFNEQFARVVEAPLKRGAIRLTKSKKAFEIRANVTWDKGRATLWMLERDKFRGTVPIYLGDDETDKDGYRAAGAAGGVSVNVGGAVEEAQYYLLAQEEVRVFLKWLCHYPAVTKDWFGER